MTSKTLIRYALAAAIAAGTGGLAAGGFGSPALAQQAVEPSTASYSDEKLRAFADAAMAVDAVNRDYVDRIAGAETAADRDELAMQANEETVEAIEGVEGVSVEEFLQIAEAVQTDPAVAERVQGYLGELGAQ